MLKIIHNYTIGDIIDSIKYLLDKSAHSEEVRSLAIQITCDSQDKISSIYDWVKPNFAYIPDPIGASGDEIELFISPIKVVRDFNQGLNLGGDCDDHALLNTALYRALGMPSNVVLMDSGNGIDHAYCRVKSEKLGRWVNADTTTNAPLGWVFPAKQEIVI